MRGKPGALSDAAIETMTRAASGDANKLGALAALLCRSGQLEKAYAVAREARVLAPDDPDVASLTQAPLAANVPGWHFGIVRDEARNSAYDAALTRAVRPGIRVLDIGSGTGLLAMMAARTGAESVITCERNPAVADAAAEIVALNGFSSCVKVVGKISYELDADADMGGRAQLLVCEIVSADLLSEMPLPVMEDAVPRLLEPGAQVIPCSGQVRVALAYWAGLADRRLGDVAGFNLSPFNRLDSSPRKVAIGDPDLALRSEAADLFDFDFASGGPYQNGRTSIGLIADRGPVNGIVQWIRLQLDSEGVYENRPVPGATSCWTALFYPFEHELDVAPGEPGSIEGAHHRTGIRIWSRPRAQ